jgi:hypothetical protein
MNAYKLRAEIEEALLRNLRVLATVLPGQFVNCEFPTLATRDVRDMLKSCAANLAQAYADRIADAPSHGNLEKSTTPAPDRTR